VRSLRRPGSARRFVAGDTLVVEARSDIGSRYDLRVFLNSSLVLDKSAAVTTQSFTEQVPLVPPFFHAGAQYSLFFDVCVLNKPIPAVSYLDSASYTFEVASTETKLGLVAKYDSTFKNLYACANLTDTDGYPVTNETVSFYLQLERENCLNNGWIPLGSSLTDNNGTAALSYGLLMPFSNQMIVKACHEDDGNFGSSEESAVAEAGSDLTEGLLGYRQLENYGANENLLGNVGNLSITISTDCTYALMATNVTARYTSDNSLTGLGYPVVVFHVDYVNFTGDLGSFGLALAAGGGDSGYVYENTQPWYPNMTGSHLLIGGFILAKNINKDIAAARYNGTGIIAWANVTLNIQRCPSNLVISFPQAVYGNVVPNMTVAFSGAWPYEASNRGGFTSCTLAPQLVYNGISYVIDYPVGRAHVELYVNGTCCPGTWVTDDNGVASLDPQLGFSYARFTLNITVVVNDPSLLHEDRRVESDVNFAVVSLQDTTTGGDSVFMLDCKVGQQAGEGGTVYVGGETPVQTSATLFNLPVSGVPVSVLAGKPKGRSCTNATTGWDSIPQGSSLIRACLYDIGSTNAANATCDINRDGKVNVIDYFTVTMAYGSSPGYPKWNWRADINFDLKVNVIDVFTCALNFGKDVNYTSVPDYSVVMANFSMIGGGCQTASLDQCGCVSVPSGANCVQFHVGGRQAGAIVEFFSAAFDGECCTDNVGAASVSWVPPETASANASPSAWYFVSVWLPSSFNVSTTQNPNVTMVSTALSFVSFLNVEKRPITMSVDYAPKQPTLDDTVTMSASCFDTALGRPGTGLGVTFLVYDMLSNYIWMGNSTTNSSGVATFSWSPRYYYSTYHLLAYFVLDVVCGETAFTLGAEVVPVTVDTRYPTVLNFSGNLVMNVPVGSQCSFSVRLARADNGDPVSNKNIRLYLNDTCINDGTSTDNNGICSWSPPWSPPQSGIYFFRACFSDYDETYRPPNDARLVVVAAVIPTMVLFDVQPREFSPSTPMTLTATVLNATSNDPLNNPLQGYTVRFFEVDADGSQAQIGLDAVTNSSGVASLSWHYDSFPGVHAYTAVVATGQQMMTSPVMLTVAKETSLALNVTMNPNFNYTLSGCLLSYGVPVGNKPVGIYVNSTLKTNVTTMDYYGNFSLTLNLPSANNNPTEYNIQAAFEGDSPCNTTAYSTTPNGTQYAVCTTIQYGYKPSSNATVLIVKPQSTDYIVTMAKTPEQMQKEAEGGGQLETKPKFSWWFPWFWLETTVCNPILNFSLVTCTSVFGGWLGNCFGLENPLFQIFAGVTAQQVDVLTSAAIASITTTAATFIGGYIATSATEWSLVGYLAALIVYQVGGLAALYYVYSFFDAYTARAALITAGFTLLALSTLGFTKTIPIFVSNIVGGDTVTAAVKCIVNSILGFAIMTTILRALGASVLKLPFYVITFVLGLTALYLGYTKI
jgi:hypothetical protein